MQQQSENITYNPKVSFLRQPLLLQEPHNKAEPTPASAGMETQEIPHGSQPPPADLAKAQQRPHTKKKTKKARTHTQHPSPNKAKYTSITKQTLEPRKCTTYTHPGNTQSTPRTHHQKHCLPQASPLLLPRGQYSSQPGMRAFFSRQPLCQDLRKVNTSAVLNLTKATDHPPLQQTAAGALHTSHSESSIPPGANTTHS